MFFGVMIFEGIHARSRKEAALANETQQAAIASVDVAHPSLGAASLEVTLPANVQAFIDTPVYARTSGYLLHWYADIGAHVQKGRVTRRHPNP